MPSQRKYAFFALLTISVCILASYIYRHRQGQTGKIDNFLISSVGAVQKHSFYFSHGLRGVVDHYLLVVNAKKENEKLTSELGEARSKLTALEDLKLENQRLRDALDFQKHATQKLVPAHVIAQDVSSEYVGIRIDRGSDSGIEKGMGVVSPAGVVGLVQRVAANYADVLTIVDPTSKIDAVIMRSRARGVVSGQAKELTCKMKYVDRLEDVAVEDSVVASGFGGVFPKGHLIGFVTAVVPANNGILQSVSIRTAVDIYRLEEVFIVFPATQPEKTS